MPCATVRADAAWVATMMSSNARGERSPVESTHRASERVSTRQLRDAEMVSRDHFNQMIARSMSEAVWEEHIQRLLEGAGFQLHYHTHRSDRSDPGFPDDVAIHRTEPRLVIIEAKRQSGVLTDTQVGWLDGWARLRDVATDEFETACSIEVYAPVRPLDRDALIVALFNDPYAPGALHQWCLSPDDCEVCKAERGRAKTSVLRTGRGRARRRTAE